MISGTDGFGASMRKQCLEVVGEYGIEIVADESYGPTDADMTPQLTNIKNTDGVQAVLNPGFGQGPSVVTRNYQQLAVGLPLYQSHGVASKGFIDLAGADAAEGVRLPGTALLVGDLLADDDPQKPVVKAYVDEYQAAYGEAPSTFGGYAHDAFAILVDAHHPRRLRRARGHPRRHRGDLRPRRHHRRRHHDPGGPPRLRPLGLPHARDQGRQLDPRPVTPPGARVSPRAPPSLPLELDADGRTHAIPPVRRDRRRGLRAGRPRLHHHLQRLRRGELRPGRVRDARRHDHRLRPHGRPAAPARRADRHRRHRRWSASPSTSSPSSPPAARPSSRSSSSPSAPRSSSAASPSSSSTSSSTASPPSPATPRSRSSAPPSCPSPSGSSPAPSPSSSASGPSSPRPSPAAPSSPPPTTASPRSSSASTPTG